jgi:hypothetical protein
MDDPSPAEPGPDHALVTTPFLDWMRTNNVVA